MKRIVELVQRATSVGHMIKVLKTVCKQLLTNCCSVGVSARVCVCDVCECSHMGLHLQKQLANKFAHSLALVSLAHATHYSRTF